ncbi:intraflagellar transport particle protein, putative [Eimeria mitis]|uniref:Intraflagellar transport particle protein, putative n=1 Tax=Eimeria mitis TaxID=44415 RepID=U6KE71_9EIME|nr:intraflagellar transport particle protein, putative [Eimeria mitis]CDJ33773.1 intraflagellar transport particle protein, putative [Eimeria mitis]
MGWTVFVLPLLSSPPQLCRSSATAAAAGGMSRSGSSDPAATAAGNGTDSLLEPLPFLSPSSAAHAAAATNSANDISAGAAAAAGGGPGFWNSLSGSGASGAAAKQDTLAAAAAATADSLRPCSARVPGLLTNDERYLDTGTAAAEAAAANAYSEAWASLLRAVSLAEAEDDQAALQAAREAAAAASAAAAAAAAVATDSELPGDTNVLSLELAAGVHLAGRLERLGLYDDAHEVYNGLLADTRLPETRKMLLANIGCMLLKQQRPQDALKAFKAALDNIHLTTKDQGYKLLRAKLLRSVAGCHFSLGRYLEAAEEYEQAIELAPEDVQSIISGFNLVLCYAAIGDAARMHDAFLMMLSLKKCQIQSLVAEEEELRPQETAREAHSASPPVAGATVSGAPPTAAAAEAAVAAATAAAVESSEADERRQADEAVLKAARWLVASGELQPQAAYEGVISTMRQHGFDDLAGELQLELAMQRLREGQVEPAVAAYKAFKLQRPRLLLRASINLCFIFLLEGNIQQANTYADIALKADRRSAKALVNKGCALSLQGQHEEAAALFNEAASVDPHCQEALYNLTVTWRKLGRLRPWDLDAATWLGIELVKAQNFKEASSFFNLAAQLQPTESKWRQLAALCLRKSGQLGPALLLYEALHKELPDDANISKHLRRTRVALGLQAP